MEENNETENEVLEQSASETESLAVEVVQNQKKPSLLTQSMTFRFMLVFGIVFMSFVFIFQLWLTPIKVVGSSMQPTINTKIASETDEIHCDIVYYDDEKSYSHDDIVIVENNDYKYIPYLEYEDASGNKMVQDIKNLIKRIIACPGDTITFFLEHEETTLLQTTFYYDIIVKDKYGNILNLDESYLEEPMAISYEDILYHSHNFPFFAEIFRNISNTSLPIEQRQYTYTVPEDSYFIMGDNRNNSEDSRYFGVVSHEDIAGSVRLQIPYGKNIIQAIWIKLKSLI